MATTPELPEMQDLIPAEASQPPKPIEPMPGMDMSQDLMPAENHQQAMPGTAVTQAAAGPTDTVPSAGTEVTAEQTTRGQLEDLLGGSSRYLQDARERGKRAAAERGNVNSNLAAQSGELAAIQSALPIAQSDAQAYERRALSTQEHMQALTEMSHQGKISSSLQAQGHFEAMEQLARNGDIQARLLLQKAGYDSQLSAQENLQRMEQQALQGNIEAALALQQFNHSSLLEEIAQGNRIELANVQFQHEQGLLFTQLDNAKVLRGIDQENWIAQQNVLHANTLSTIGAELEARISEIGALGDAEAVRDLRQNAANLQSQYLASVSNIQIAASQEIAAIMSTEGLTPSMQTNAVSQVWNRVRSNIDMLGAQYASSPFWDTRWGQQDDDPYVLMPGEDRSSVPSSPPQPASPPSTTTTVPPPPSAPSNYPIRPQDQWLLDNMANL